MKKLSLITMALVAATLMSSSAFAVDADHFDGGANLTQGSKKGSGGTLAEILNVKPDYAATTLSVTFDQGVGAKTILVKKIGKFVSLEIPSGSTADGGGVAISGTAIAAAYRPAATISWPAIVTNNAALVQGKVTLSSAGVLIFTSSAAGASFTDNAAAGFDRLSLSYQVP